MAIGDFDDVDGVVETVREFMEPCQPHNTGHAVEVPRSASNLLHALSFDYTSAGGDLHHAPLACVTGGNLARNGL